MADILTQMQDEVDMVRVELAYDHTPTDGPSS